MRKDLLVLCIMNASLVFAQIEKLIYHDIKVDRQKKLYSGIPVIRAKFTVMR